MTLSFASWNVNSVKVRLPHIIRFCKESKIDVLSLQETKVEDHNFPKEEIEKLGYQVIYSGEKQYNGVAILSRYDLQDVVLEFEHDPLKQKRYLASTINGVRVVNVYVPNGSELESDKYQIKLQWLKYFTNSIKKELEKHKKLVIMGDFNIAPTDIDVYDPKKWQNRILVSPKERAAFKKLLDLGLTDLFRHQHPHSKEYSWWDYRTFAFKKNLGLRIDHMLVSKGALALASECYIDKNTRSWERPSDHGVVIAKFCL